MLVATAAMGALLWFLPPFLEPLPDWLGLFLLCGAGGLAFFAVAELTGAASLLELKRQLVPRRA